MVIKVNSDLNSEQWNKFVVDSGVDGGFLQSWQWGEFQESLGRKIFRIVAVDGGKIIGVALAVRQNLPLGQNYIYSPRGPLAGKDSAAEIIKAISKIAREERSLFVRLDPAWGDDKVLADSGFKNIGQVQPKKTLILDLAKSEAELLEQMKPKTRYNIKVANKHGVEIRNGGEGDFELFWELMAKTCRRDGIKCHAKGYYQKQLKIPGFRLVLAWWQNRAIAGAIMSDFGTICTYVHGASDHDYRDKMAPYLLQWEMIRQAKQAGQSRYDFWGADESNPKWSGVTRFKLGFAPQQPLTGYIGAYDLPIRPVACSAYNFLKRIL